MSQPPTLRIEGEVAQPREITLSELAALPEPDQVRDMSQIDPKRQGEAVRLEAILRLVGVRDTAQYLGLHAETDNFHASIPLEPVRNRGLLIYRLHGEPVPVKQGGPFRFYIPDFAACHTHEIDECANVKFVDRMELTATPGFDNRPHDGASHEELHRKNP